MSCLWRDALMIDWSASLLLLAGLICLLLLWWLWDTVTSMLVCGAVYLVSRLVGRNNTKDEEDDADKPLLNFRAGSPERRAQEKRVRGK